MLLFLMYFALNLPAHAFSAPGVDWSSLLTGEGAQAVQFGVWLGGEADFQKNADREFAPASNSKLFTAALLFNTLGPDYSFTTRAEWKNRGQGIASGLVLVGNGDPSWGMVEVGEGLTTRLDALARALWDRGIREVRGPIQLRAADSRWNDSSLPAGWQERDLVSCDGARAQAFNLNINCATFLLSGPSRGAWKEEGMAFPVRLHLVQGAENRFTVAAEIKGGRVAAFTISGTWRGGTHSFVLPLPDTRPWIRSLFTRALTRQGIRLGSAPAGAASNDRDASLELRSPPVRALLKPFLKNSLNFLGDAFLKAVGARLSGSTPLAEAGLLDLQRLLLGMGIREGVHLLDGSGLSRDARVTPRALHQFLSRLREQPGFPLIWDALPIAGVDGTLAKRMQGSAAAGVLRAKTGTLDGVYNLSGYVPADGAFVPFVLLTSTTPDLRQAARAAEDRVGARFTQFVRGGLPAAVPLPAPYPYFPEHEGRDSR